jgi:hypothetical protein
LKEAKAQQWNNWSAEQAFFNRADRASTLRRAHQDTLHLQRI